MLSTVLLVRHGDRFDYASGASAWKERCRRQRLEPSDPPLSALGHAQAREVAAHLAKQGVARILCSPYLRALQTAQPLAHLTSLPLCVDFALAEAHQKPSVVPPLASRLPYLPEVDEGYSPLLSTVATTTAPGASQGVESRMEHLRRMLYLARELRLRYRGQTVALVTHAASVALVAALVGSESLEEAGKLAPCGVCALVSEDGGESWSVRQGGDDNTGYVSSNAPTTFP